eukprot:3118192-Pyramimonas_sp.AAC.1
MAAGRTCLRASLRACCPPGPGDPGEGGARDRVLCNWRHRRGARACSWQASSNLQGEGRSVERKPGTSGKLREGDQGR